MNSPLVLQFLSHDWAGLAIAASVGALGGVLWWRWRRWPALLPLAVAVPLAIGALVHIWQAAALAERYPAPGRMVEVAGIKIHVQAEGPAIAGRPTLVWFGGAHSGGAAMWHLHRALSRQFRSVLIDRPGTGWSGVANFPRTTDGEAMEMWQALAAAGERGPFILVGHSFGGLLIANMARSQPGKVKALVLLDATPPDVIIYGPDLGASQLSSQAFRAGLAALFGLDLEAMSSRPTDVDPVERAMAAELGSHGEALKAQSMLPRSQMAGASIYSELSPAGLAQRAWRITVYDGELGDMPVYLVAPDSLPPAAALPGSPSDRGRLLNLLKRGRERYLALSSNSQRVIAPAWTGHNFIYQSPQTVIDTVRRAACGGQKTTPAAALSAARVQGLAAVPGAAVVSRWKRRISADGSISRP